VTAAAWRANFPVSEAAIEGLIEVATFPNSAGRRGRVPRHDWAAIVDYVRERPGRRYICLNVPGPLLDRLVQRYPDVTFRGYNHRWELPLRGQQRRVCDVGIEWTGERE
jgi:hypothetical protein